MKHITTILQLLLVCLAGILLFGGCSDNQYPIGYQGSHHRHYVNNLDLNMPEVNVIDWPDEFDPEDWFIKETNSDPDGDFNDEWNENTPLGHELKLALSFAPDKCNLLGYLLEHKASSWNINIKL